MNLIELAERVEKASGPDRELDAEIARLNGLRVVDELLGEHFRRVKSQRAAGYAEGIEAAAKVAESWISSLRPDSIDRMNGQLEARREIASRIRALRDTNHA